MRYSRRSLICAAMILSLASCRSSEPTTTTPLPETAAVDAVYGTIEIILGNRLARPASLLGPYVSSYIAMHSAGRFQSALGGVETQVSLVMINTPSEEDTFLLLQDLGATLQVDIRDQLNRSTDRVQTLDSYISVLSHLLDRARKQREFLEIEQDTLANERSAQRKVVGDVQHQLNLAVRAKDFAQAGVFQEQLNTERSKQSNLELKERELRNSVDLMEDLIEIGDERLSAILQNRLILLSGLKVLEVPGIEDLGILEEINRRASRRNSQNTENSPLGPTF